MPCLRDESFDQPGATRPAAPWARAMGARAGTGVLWLALAGTALPFQALAQAPAATPAANPADGAAQLTAAVRNWAAARHRVAATSLTVQLPDTRVAIRPCANAWQFDQPFSQAGTVRARCDAPAWQLYVQLQGLQGSAAPIQAAAPAAAGQALAGQGQAPAAAWVPTAATPSAPAPTVRTLVTVTSLLPRGTRLQPEHLVLAEVPAYGLPPQMIERVSDALQAEIVRDLPAGTPLRPTDIRPALMVKRGQNVTMLASPVPGLRIAANLEALDDGRMGETVRLRNRESGRIVSATVTGPSSVQGM